MQVVPLETPAIFLQQIQSCNHRRVRVAGDSLAFVPFHQRLLVIKKIKLIQEPNKQIKIKKLGQTLVEKTRFFETFTLDHGGLRSDTNNREVQGIFIDQSSPVHFRRFVKSRCSIFQDSQHIAVENPDLGSRQIECRNSFFELV